MSTKTESLAEILDARPSGFFERLSFAFAPGVRIPKPMSFAESNAIAKQWMRAIEELQAAGDEKVAAQYGAPPVSKLARSRALDYMLVLHQAVPELESPGVSPTTDGAVVMQWVIPKTTRGEVHIDLLFFPNRSEMHVDFADQDDDPIEESLKEPPGFIDRLREIVGGLLITE